MEKAKLQHFRSKIWDPVYLLMDGVLQYEFVIDILF